MKIILAQYAGGVIGLGAGVFFIHSMGWHPFWLITIFFGAAGGRALYRVAYPLTYRRRLRHQPMRLWQGLAALSLLLSVSAHASQRSDRLAYTYWLAQEAYVCQFRDAEWMSSIASQVIQGGTEADRRASAAIGNRLTDLRYCGEARAHLRELDEIALYGFE